MTPTPTQTNTGGAFEPLPRAPLPRPGDTHLSYGARLLTFVLDTGCTAVLSDEQLALADHAYPALIAGPEIEPRAVDNLTRVRHHVLAAMTNRRAFDAEVDHALASTAPPHTHKPNEGPMAKLQPPTPVQPSPSVAKVVREVVCDF